MKKVIYELIVDVWRLVSRYQFRKLTDSEWEQFVLDGTKLCEKYRASERSVERLFRDMFLAFQDFYKRMGDQNEQG